FRKRSELALRLLRTIDDDFARVLEDRRAVDPTDRDSIHRLRIALKKFRYSVEAIESLLQGFTRRHLEQLHEIQDLLGDLHDFEMISASFRDFLEKKVSTQAPRLLPLQKRVMQQHHGELRKALVSTDRILGFWQEWTGTGDSRLRSSAPSRIKKA